MSERGAVLSHPSPVLVQFKERQRADSSRPGPRSRLPRLFLPHLQNQEAPAAAQWTPCDWSTEWKRRPMWSGPAQQKEAADSGRHWSHEESQGS